jgi:hypothetical protein
VDEGDLDLGHGTASWRLGVWLVGPVDRIGRGPLPSRQFPSGRQPSFFTLLTVALHGGPDRLSGAVLNRGGAPTAAERRAVHPKNTTTRRRTGLLLLVVGTALAALVTAAVPTYSLNTRQTGPRDNRGFPLFYTDDGGLPLRLCQSGTRQCQGADRGDLVPPNGENFYWLATATIRSQSGPVDVELALEAAFGGARGRLPIVFDRLRIRGHLREAGRYVLDHPYGSTGFRAITPAEQRNVDFTRDLGCSVKRAGRCNERIDKFLRSTAKTPKGYIGFGGKATTVRGGTERNSLILRTADGTVIGQTDKFVIMGRRAGRLARR